MFGASKMLTASSSGCYGKRSTFPRYRNLEIRHDREYLDSGEELEWPQLGEDHRVQDEDLLGEVLGGELSHWATVD